MFKILRNRNFSLLFWGRLITNFGDSLYSIAAMLLVYKMSGSTFYSGITLFLTSSTALIQLLLSPILDRINMKKFLVNSQLLQALLILIIPTLYYFEKLTVLHIMVIMPIISLINQLVYPGQISLLPKILSENELLTGNSLMNMAYQGSNAVFDTLAGLTIAAWGFMVAFYIDTATFIVTALLFSLLSNTLALSSNPVDFSGGNALKKHFKELKEGLSLFKDARIFALVCGIVLINFSATSISAVLPAFSDNEIFYSLLLTAMGAGLLLGSLCSSSDFLKNLPLGKLYIYGMALTGFSWMGSSYLNRHQWIAVALYALGWFIVGVVNVYAQTMVQMIVPKEKLASAMGAMVGISSFLAPLGALLGGWLGEYIGSPKLILIASILIILVSVYWAVNSSIRKLPRVNKLHELFLPE